MDRQQEIARLQFLLKETGMNCRSLAQAIGKNNQTFYDIKNGRHGFSKDVAEAITKKFPHINKAWILAGEGDFCNNTTSADHIEQTGNNNIGKIQGGDCGELGELIALRRENEILKDLLAKSEERCNAYWKIIESRIGK